MNKTIVVIQARNGSCRLPYKSVLSLNGTPVIGHIVNYILKNLTIPFPIVVATSTRDEDQSICDLLKSYPVQVFRGHPSDVLSRFSAISSIYNPFNIVRITGDCPLVSAPVIEELVDVFNANPSLDYASNTINRTFPHGFDVEIFRARLILESNLPLLSEVDREHVTPFMYKNIDSCLYNLALESDFSNIRVTLDTGADYVFLDKLIRVWKDIHHDLSIPPVMTPGDIQSLINQNKILSKYHIAAKASALSHPIQLFN